LPNQVLEKYIFKYNVQYQSDFEFLMFDSKRNWRICR